MKTLRPIEHRNSYTDAVQREILVWFREAFFFPVQLLLREQKIELDPKYQATKFDEFGRTNAADWIAMLPEWGGLGIPRSELPQIPSGARGALTQFLAARGITYTEEMIPAQDLRPTQEGWYESRVWQAAQNEGDRAILVSSDFYILDGHHQWVSLRLGMPEQPIRCLRFDAPIRALIRNAKLLPSSFRENAAMTLLEEALNKGTVQYAAGVFSGRFNAGLTRELRGIGARFDNGTQTFRIAEADIPVEIRGILARAAERAEDTTNRLLGILREIEQNVATANAGLQLKRALNAIEGDLGRQLLETTATISPENIGITPEISPQTREAIDQQFTNNLELAIKGWARERIPELRRRVEENAFKFGGRADRLAKIIESEFGIARRKAEFLADQETGLLVSKYRAEKYAQLGIREYTWSTSHDSRVRATHARLDGKRFSFAVGANVAEPGKPARYCNPGEDYRCRCVPRPIINLEELAA